MVKQFYLTHRWNRNRYYPFQVWVDLGIMAMKGYSTYLKSPKLKPHHQMQFNVISRTLIHGGGLPLCRDSELQLIGLLLKIVCHLAIVPRKLPHQFLISVTNPKCLHWIKTHLHPPYIQWMASGQVLLKALIPTISPKLCSNEFVKYLHGWPLSNSRCCKHSNTSVPD